MAQNIFFFDTETTSADPERASVVEIAVYYPTDEWYVMREERCNPTNTIEIGAMATHHITQEMVKDAPKFTDTRCADFFKHNPDSIAVAHNAPYDVQVLKNEGIEIREYIDTLQVARHILQDDEPESFSLQYLRYFYKLDSYSFPGELPNTMAHSAGYDTVVLKWLFEYLCERIHKLSPTRDIIDEMVRLTHTPVILKVLNFGKYKGVPVSRIAQMDAGYLRWLRDNSDSKDTIATCNYYL